MLLQALVAVRDLSRLHDIAVILIRYGFGDIVERMGLTHALERAGQVLHHNNATQYAHLPAHTRVRRALEEMGPTFVKLGQVLATRVDLFEPEWITEFGKLQDNAPPVPYAVIRQQLFEDLAPPPRNCLRRSILLQWQPPPSRKFTAPVWRMAARSWSRCAARVSVLSSKPTCAG